MSVTSGSMALKRSDRAKCEVAGPMMLNDKMKKSVCVVAGPMMLQDEREKCVRSLACDVQR